VTYPTVAEVLADVRFKPAALSAVRAFKREHPWRGTQAERLEKFARLNAALAEAYDITPPALRLGAVAAYSPRTHTIKLRNLSVVTYLHEFGHALGRDERGACRWSINLFRRVWPREYAQCHHVGHMLVRI
jgi:hypothetical protein